MVFSTLQFPDYPRASVRAGLVAAGVPAHHVDEVVDLACLAAANARASMLLVLDRASIPSVSTCAVGIAASLMKADADRLIEALQSYATDRGLQAREFKVKG